MPQPDIATIAEIVRVHGAERPDAIALDVGDRTITFAELDARSSRVAHAFQAAGVTSGDRVAFIEKNGGEGRRFAGGGYLARAGGSDRFRPRPAGGLQAAQVHRLRRTVPRNPSGKLLKRQLREPYWEGVERRVR